MMFKWICYALVTFGAFTITDGLLRDDGRIMFLLPMGLMFIIVGTIWRIMLAMPDEPRRGRSRRSSFSFWDIFDGSGSGGGGFDGGGD